MRFETELHVESRSMIRWTRIAVVVIAVVSLLAPALLCVVPAAPMSASEHACCEDMHMAQGCDEAKVSACCTTVAFNAAVGVPTVTKTSLSLSEGAQEYSVLAAFEFVRAVRAASSRIDLENSSPPRAFTPDSIQVLRI
jgi:hypothetical protein